MDNLYMTDEGHMVLITDAEDEWYNTDEEDEGCEGHETLRGDMMGVSVFCDGSCNSR